jgi:hypothetical protein
MPPDNTIADTGQQITCRACLRATAAERILTTPALALGPPREPFEQKPKSAYQRRAGLGPTPYLQKEQSNAA